MAAVGVVLLAACANLAGLMIARSGRFTNLMTLLVVDVSYGLLT